MQHTMLTAARPHFTVFGLDIYYYAVIIVFGVLCATAVVAILFKHRNIPIDWTIDLLLCILPLGIIGARTFYVLTDPSTDITEWFTGFRDGGLSILGGVLFGSLGVVLFCLIHKISFLRVADCLVPGVILAQGIGRWGNFVNQEVYGAKVVNEALQWFPLAVRLDNGEWHYAFFFYESMLNLAIFAGLFVLMWKFKKKPSGLALALYCIGYGGVRSVMEPLRDPEFILGSSVPVSMVVALIIFCVGVVLFASLLLWNYLREGCPFGSRTGEPLSILPVYYTREQRKKKLASAQTSAGGKASAENAPAAGKTSAAENAPAADQPSADKASERRRKGTDASATDKSGEEDK